MEPARPHSARQLFELRTGAAPVVFEEAGLWHPAGLWRRAGEFTRYADITHLAASGRGLWLGTRRGVWLLRGTLFREKGDAVRLAGEITSRIAASPRGAEQLSRMAEIDRVATRRGGVRATVVLAGLCLAIFGLQSYYAPFVHTSVTFSSTLAGAGEWWRLLTANLLHGGPGHLVINLLGLVFLGNLVERPLGLSRTAIVMAAAALGAMGASAWVGAEDVVGASGVVFGLAGAALFLELFRADRLPASLRIPRRLFLVALAVDIVLGAILPFIAGAAHVGGLVSGYLAAALLARDRTLRSRPRLWVRTVAAAAGLATVAALAAAGPLVFGDPSALVRHGRRLLSLSDVHPLHLNNVAWRIATEHPATPSELAVARQMAERAAEDTHREQPDILDTLAELEWVTGDTERALRTIDEAIALAPGEDYFVEQRRRFTGERDAGDRPDPPAAPGPSLPFGPGPAPEKVPDDDLGVWI